MKNYTSSLRRNLIFSLEKSRKKKVHLKLKAIWYFLFMEKMELMWEVGEIAVVENKNSELLQNTGIAVKQL